MNIIGEVKGRTCVIMDDMVDTAGTLVKAAQVLKERGRDQGGGVLHARGAVRAGGRAHRGLGHRRAGGDRHHPAARGRAGAASKIRQLSVAGLLAETILRIYTEESVSSLFIE